MQLTTRTIWIWIWIGDEYCITQVCDFNQAPKSLHSLTNAKQFYYKKGYWFQLNPSNMVYYHLKFKKGKKIEVQSKRDLPSGSWRPATLISGNGHTYYIQYDQSEEVTHSPAIEKVPRKLIRPCPPMKFVENWKAGDLVEVFDFCLWKPATVVEVMNEHLFMVKLNGMSKKLKAYKSHLRVPQSLETDGWVITRKKTIVHQADTKDSVPESNKIFSRKLKRGSSDISGLELNAGTSRKMRVIEKVGDLCKRVPVPEYLTTSSPNADASLSNKKCGHSQSDLKAINQNRNVRCSVAGNLKPLADSNGCSFGGCSHSAHNSSTFPDATASSSHTWSHSSSPNPGQGNGNNAVGSFLDECKKGQTLQIGNRKTPTHEYDLNVYRRTIWSMFSSGYITWEQESIITNLRIKLHISTDEHLRELRKIRPAEERTVCPVSLAS